MSALEDQIAEWFREPPARHRGRKMAIGVAAAGVIAGAAAAYELRPARETSPPSTRAEVLRLDPIYVFAPREAPAVISAQK